MLALAISVLWFLIGVVILGAVIWAVFWVIENFLGPVPEMIKKAVWVIVLLLVAIALLTVLAGSGASIRLPSCR
jgi:hypothetical protein